MKKKFVGLSYASRRRRKLLVVVRGGAARGLHRSLEPWVDVRMEVDVVVVVVVLLLLNTWQFGVR